MKYETKRIFQDGISNFGTYIRTLVRNLLYSAKRDQLQKDLANLRNLVLSLPAEEKQKYSEECKFVEQASLDNLCSILFPYPKREDKGVAKIVSGIENGLPYVLHNEKEKLFFPKGASAASAYSSLINWEGILGNGSLLKSPHRYECDEFKVNNGDVLLDIGCAEALFALDNIHKVSKAYLFECDKEWNKALKRTFYPFADKVVHVNKLVADKTDNRSTTLCDTIDENLLTDANFFVKMDIEGWERTVIKGNFDFFKSAKVVLSCCVYHRQDDAQVIETMLKDLGYATRFSDGYMLPLLNGVYYPYFRHGIIYAKNY